MRKVYLGGTAVLVAAIIAAILAQGAPPGCTTQATTANVSSQLSAASGGAVICLAAGDYSSFPGPTLPSGGVTLRPAPGVAKSAVTVSLIWNDASIYHAAYMTFDGITLETSVINGPAHDITIKNSHIYGRVTIFGGSRNGTDDFNNSCGNCPALANSNIVFSGDDFDLAMCPDGECDAGNRSQEGMLGIISGNATDPMGITVIDDSFHGACADGIALSGNNAGRGVTIQSNHFYDLPQAGCGVHVDSIQLNGHPGGIGGECCVQILGNFLDGSVDDGVDTGIMAYDGTGPGVDIEDNVLLDVLGNGGSGNVINLGGANAPTVEHNTIFYTSGNVPFINFGSKAGQQTTGAVAIDNVTPGGVGSAGDGLAATFAQDDYNLCSSLTLCGDSHSVAGTPVFTGGTSPTHYSAFALAGGSPGKGAASDGADMGVRVGG